MGEKSAEGWAGGILRVVRDQIGPPFNSKWKAKAAGLVDATRVVELTNPKEWEK